MGGARWIVACAHRSSRARRPSGGGVEMTNFQHRIMIGMRRCWSTCDMCRSLWAYPYSLHPFDAIIIRAQRHHMTPDTA